ncbi:Cx9C motif-containing protein 4 [Trichoderma lentiforme]|uniref:Cx9C motif-containing protein 4, mitochondrial n=1 Tax=Trichoderma lentiforme TaxID=1567552 RepID=A0A9P5CHJ9_9HYPO|nr:Cx9C motif-containing protein 4 [Trichoderma lentiforme]
MTADCLTKNNYNEARCQNAIKALYECCDAFYQRYGDDATSPSCPKPKLLRLKIQQQKEGK